MTEASRICARRAALHRELAELDEELGRALASRDADDAVLSLKKAARYMGEPTETFRRRGEYLKARVSRDGERRARYSRAELDRIKRDRLAANAVH